MIETLTELRDILTRQGYHGQASVISRLVELQEADPTEFRTLLQSVEMWGGSGAVWEVYPLGEGSRRFTQLIVQLAQEMQLSGLGTSRSQDIADTFRYWLAARLR